MVKTAVIDPRHYDAKAPRFKNWETPPDFFKKLDEEFGFTLDAAASHENALCNYYCTVDGSFAKVRHDARPDRKFVFHPDKGDGLTRNWNDERVFCNPPYDTSVSKWVDKAFRFEAEVAVLLLPPNFETAWGQRIKDTGRESLIQWVINDGVWTEKSVEIRLPPGRLRFWRSAFRERPPGIPKFTLKDYGELSPIDGEIWGDRIFDYSKPHVPGEAPRAGNLIAIFRR